MATLADTISREQTVIYEAVLNGAVARRIPFAMCGAFAVGFYTGGWRDTKDLDLTILERDRDAMVEVLTDAGLNDYFDELPYDRGWIYRGHRNGTIVDVIWAMANRRAFFDERFVQEAPRTEFLGIPVRVIPPEELIWDKLYIMQRQRCDWPDLLNIVHATAGTLDWDRLLERIADDTWLLAGVMATYRWLCPGEAGLVPDRVWERLHMPAPSGEDAPRVDARRVNFLDTRPWFNGIKELTAC